MYSKPLSLGALRAYSPRSTARVMVGLLGLLGMAGCDQIGTTHPGDMTSISNPDMAVALRYGLVLLSSASTGTASVSGGAAMFLDPSAPGAGCQRQAQGECMLYYCSGNGFVLPSAGTVTVTGGTQAVTMMPNADGSYNLYGSSGTIFPASQKLTVSAPGQSVPAFSADVTPSGPAFMLTTPDASRPAITFSVSKRQDYQVVWMPLTAGSRVHAELSQAAGTNRALFLECSYDGARGNGVLPAGLISKFTTSGTSSDFASFVVGPEATASATPTGWEISVVAISNGRSGTASVTDP